MDQPLPVVLLGGGGHAREIADALIRSAGGDETVFAGVLADWLPESTKATAFAGHLLGPIESLARLERVRYVSAVGDPHDRRKLASLADGHGREAAVIVDPTARLGARVTIGRGVYIGAGVVVTVDVDLEEHVHVNIGCSVSHDCRIGRFSTLSPGATLCGGVVLGEDVQVGAGATILPGVRVGSGAVVGAGAVITRDVAAGTVVVGVPGRPVK